MNYHYEDTSIKDRQLNEAEWGRGAFDETEKEKNIRIECEFIRKLNNKKERGKK